MFGQTALVDVGKESKLYSLRYQRMVSPPCHASSISPTIQPYRRAHQTTWFCKVVAVGEKWYIVCELPVQLA